MLLKRPLLSHRTLSLDNSFEFIHYCVVILIIYSYFFIMSAENEYDRELSLITRDVQRSSSEAELQDRLLYQSLGNEKREESKYCNSDWNGAVTTKKWQVFGDLYGDVLEAALELVDKKCVSFYYLESNPTIGIYQVITSTDVIYVLKCLKFCVCKFYQKRAKSEEFLTCPHILSCIFAEKFNEVSRFPSTKEQLSSHYNTLLG